MDGTETQQERGRRMLREAGYGEGAKDDEEGMRAARRAGGMVPGDGSSDRPDRRARGGATGHKPTERAGQRGAGHGKPKVGTVNIIVGKDSGGSDDAGKKEAAQAGLKRGVQVGAALGARAAAAKMGAGPGGPPMPPPGGAPPMGPPGMAPGAPPALPPRPGMMAADGGMVKVREHERRRAGGSV